MRTISTHISKYSIVFAFILPIQVQAAFIYLDNNSYSSHQATIEDPGTAESDSIDISQDFAGQIPSNNQVSGALGGHAGITQGVVHTFDFTSLSHFQYDETSPVYLHPYVNISNEIQYFSGNVVTHIESKSVIDFTFQLTSLHDLYLSNLQYPGASTNLANMMTAYGAGFVSLELVNISTAEVLYSLHVENDKLDFIYEDMLPAGAYRFTLSAVSIEDHVSTGGSSFGGAQLLGPVESFILTEVAAVPIPPAAYLFVSGMLGLFGLARRKPRFTNAGHAMLFQTSFNPGRNISRNPQGSIIRIKRRKIMSKSSRLAFTCSVLTILSFPGAAYSYSLTGDQVSGNLTAGDGHTLLSAFSPSTKTVTNPGSEFTGELRADAWGHPPQENAPQYNVVIDLAGNHFTVSIVETAPFVADGIGLGPNTTTSLFHISLSSLDGGEAITSVTYNEGLSSDNIIVNENRYKYINWTDTAVDIGFKWIGKAGVYHFDINQVVVPVPASTWLFGSGLIGLIGIARQKAGQRISRNQ